MSEFGGLWKHKSIPQALVPPKTECGCPSGRRIKKGSHKLPLLWRNTEKKNQKKSARSFFGTQHGNFHYLNFTKHYAYTAVFDFTTSN